MNGTNYSGFVDDIVWKKHGIDITNNYWNVSKIPHEGGHIGAYMRMCVEEINDIQRRYNNSWTRNDMLNNLQEAVKHVQEAVKSGKISLYN